MSDKNSPTLPALSPPGRTQVSGESQATEDLLEAKAIRSGRSSAPPRLRHLAAAFDSAAFWKARFEEAERRVALLEAIDTMRAEQVDELTDALFFGSEDAPPLSFQTFREGAN